MTIMTARPSTTDSEHICLQVQAGVKAVAGGEGLEVQIPPDAVQPGHTRSTYSPLHRVCQMFLPL